MFLLSFHIEDAAKAASTPCIDASRRCKRVVGGLSELPERVREHYTRRASSADSLCAR